MKLSLRSLFWLVMIAAVLTCWGLERTRLVRRTAGTQKFWVADRRTQPTEDSLKWKEALSSRKQLSNEDLAGQASQRQSSNPYSLMEWHCDLTEMIHRKMEAELARMWPSNIASGVRNLDLLTALRRAQGKPDPLKIQVELPTKTFDGKIVDFPLVFARLKNVDDEAIGFSRGGDYRGGRSERWRVHLIDEAGHQVGDSNFLSLMGGGLIGGLHLKPGETYDSPFWIDARSYVRPPKSGRYTLQLVHTQSHIADEPDLTGMIVWKSDPVPVIVHNQDMDGYPVSAIPLVFLIAIGMVAMSVHERRVRRLAGSQGEQAGKGHWRKFLPATILLILIAAWFGDSYRLRMQIEEKLPDSEASWTMKLAS